MARRKRYRTWKPSTHEHTKHGSAYKNPTLALRLLRKDLLAPLVHLGLRPTLQEMGFVAPGVQLRLRSRRTRRKRGITHSRAHNCSAASFAAACVIEVAVTRELARLSLEDPSVQRAVAALPNVRSVEFFPRCGKALHSLDQPVAN